MDLIVGVEDARRGAALRARPEWIAGAICVIFGEQVEQVADGVIIAIVENITSLTDDTVNISGLFDINEGIDIAELGADARGSCILSELFHESFRVFKKLNCILHARAEQRVELITTPFDTVLNLIREVS